MAILSSEGVKPGAKGHTLPSEAEASLFVRGGSECMTIARVVRVQLADAYLVAETNKKDRFFFAYEDVVGLKLAVQEPSKERSAGFST